MHPRPLSGKQAASLAAAATQTDASRSALRKGFIDRALAGGPRSRSTGVRWFVKYCLYGRGTLPFTSLTRESPLAARLEAEQLMMDFAIWLAICRPSGRPISAKSISKYLGQVRLWHLEEFRTDIIGELDLSQLKAVVKGIARCIQQPPALDRWGVRTQDLAKAIEQCLHPQSPTDANWAAGLTAAFCGLLRGAEFALQEGEVFDPSRHLTRADVKFFEKDGVWYAIIRMRPAKKAGATKTLPLVLGGGGTLLDPVAALKHLFEIDPVPEEQMATTPLFRHGGAAFTVEGVRAMVKAMMASIGLDPARFGAHSLRIGGATAALAAGLSPAAIRAAGRWASDVYMLYTRCNMQASQRLATVIGSTAFEDLQRGVHFADEELLLVPDEMPIGGVGEFVEDDMVRDAFELEDE